VCRGGRSVVLIGGWWWFGFRGGHGVVD
jgi:hypothetical protein